MRKNIYLLFIFFMAIFLYSCEDEKIEEKLVVENTKIEMELGETEKIVVDATKNEETTICYKSLDETVATVDSNTGVVKALKEGSTEIEVYLSTKEDDKTIISVTVNMPFVEEIIIDNPVMEVGLFKQALIDINVKKFEETELILNVVDSTIACVNDGMIEGLKEGETFLEVSLSTNVELVKKIKIVVVDKRVLSVKINNKIEELALCQNYKAEYSINIEEKKDKVSWVSSNENIATVSKDGVITPIKKGEVQIFLLFEGTIKDALELNIVIDPLVIFDLLHIDNVLHQDVTTFGENPKEMHQDVYGSVSRYLFKDLFVEEKIIPIDNNIYKGKTATNEIIAKAEPLKLVRSGIKLEELKYIIYHDTGNAGAGADAKSHATYLVGQYNRDSRARSWHYTVDDEVIIHHIPNDEVAWQGDSYDAYAKSIGIETCVDYGSDLYKTWQNMAKLLASLLVENNMDISQIKQHYDMSQKNCPQTLRMNNLYSYAISLVEGEYIVKTLLKDYKIEFTSLSPEYLDDYGKVIKAPENDTRLGYKLEITCPNGEKLSKIYYSVIKGLNNTRKLSSDPSLLAIASSFDEKVSKISKIVTANDEEIINSLMNEYKTYSNDVKDLITSYDYLNNKEIELLNINKVDSKIIITKIAYNESNIGYSYIIIRNISSQVVDLSSASMIIEGSKQYIYNFNENVKMMPNSDLLIAVGELMLQGENIGLFATPDIVIQTDFIKDDFSISLKDNDTILDKVGVDNSSNFESNSARFKDYLYVIERKQLIDTNNNFRDFKQSNILIENDVLSTIKQLEFAYRVLSLNKEISLDDEDEIIRLIDSKNNLSENDKTLLNKYITLLDDITNRLEGLKNPSIAIVNNALKMIPTRIVDDYILPAYDGLSYSYAEGEDKSYYNIETGEYLKVSHEAKLIKLIAKHDTYQKEFYINFGVASKDDKVIYNTGGVKPSTGTTQAGNGTYDNQLSAIGFDNIALIVDNKAYFIGASCFIELSPISERTKLTKAELRPLGGVDNFYNYGIVNGVATQYKGTGALYYNNSSSDLSFDLSDTYGRNNASVYGYAKVIFSINNEGEYIVKEILGNSGTNDSTQNVQITLKPFEYLWCPHTYETGNETGTWLMNHGSNAYGGVLSLNTKVEIIKFKELK